MGVYWKWQIVSYRLNDKGNKEQEEVWYMRYQDKNGEKLTCFSIRKYRFGEASVAIE